MSLVVLYLLWVCHFTVCQVAPVPPAVDLYVPFLFIDLDLLMGSYHILALSSTVKLPESAYSWSLINSKVLPGTGTALVPLGANADVLCYYQFYIWWGLFIESRLQQL
jgi:hypothetical protein